MLTRFRNIAYVMAYAVATIPLWHYIRDGRILALMVAVVTFAYINVVLCTVQAAQPILSSEKAKTPLPRWLPDKPKYQKWWLLVRHTLKWHLLLIPPKMGLALGFAEWFHVSGFSDKTYVLREVYYSGFNLVFSYPQWETILIGTCLIGLFTLFEVCLIASLLFLARQLATSRKQLIFVVALRTILIFSTIGLLYIIRIEALDYQVYGGGDCGNYRYLWGTENPDNIALIDLYEGKCIRRRVLETGYLALLTPLDQSVLLSANIMRPLKLHPNSIWTDNRPFVARQIVAGLLGLLLYAGATWAVLWFVEDEKP
jgi:hypothetical protein